MSVPTSVPDLIGQEVAENDWIAMAYTSGQSARMFIGKVVGFTPAKMLVVRADTHEQLRQWAERGYHPGSRYSTAYEYGVKKFIKIDKPVDYADPE